ncbi:MAG: translesion error-prone DNA polymerase V autoproteolytic subunit [Muribaculaceae bacterium]|nr:translesion error-prone DNA polymerase V autoproteolytic subunit [Muribaculaceae bacterium]
MSSDDTHLHIIVPDTSTDMPLPLAESGVQAGFPSPASDYLPDSFDLNRELVRHPSATFYARVHGESMSGEGINDGDLIVVDRSLEPRNGDLCVCCIDGEFTLKRVRFEPGVVWLIPSNEAFDPILVTPGQQFEVWGVVTHTIKNHRRHS